MTDQQDPLEQLLDLLVYAPLGLALTARDIVPNLAEKGRRHFGPQATAARLVGKLATRQGQREAERLVGNARRQVEQLLGDLFPPPRPRTDDPAPPAGDATNGSRPSTAPPPRPDAPGAGAGASSSAGPVAAPGPPAGPDVSELAIPGYDTLSASQVVQRLEGLTPDELETVRAYEQARRGRKTVLNRISQLKGSP